MPHLSFQRVFSPAIAPALLVIVALTLVGCGRRGALEAPPGAPGAAQSSAQASASRLTPGLGGASRRNAADQDPLAQASRTNEVDDDEAPVTAPNRPFILDSLL